MTLRERGREGGREGEREGERELNDGVLGGLLEKHVKDGPSSTRRLELGTRREAVFGKSMNSKA